MREQIASAIRGYFSVMVDGVMVDYMRDDVVEALVDRILALPWVPSAEVLANLRDTRADLWAQYDKAGHSPALSQDHVYAAVSSMGCIIGYDTALKIMGLLESVVGVQEVEK